MGSRIDLQSKLEDILGSRNVYFQPPENLKIKYPAIIYSLNNINLRFADNMPYMKGRVGGRLKRPAPCATRLCARSCVNADSTVKRARSRFWPVRR